MISGVLVMESISPTAMQFPKAIIMPSVNAKKRSNTARMESTESGKENYLSWSPPPDDGDPCAPVLCVFGTNLEQSPINP